MIMQFRENKPVNTAERMIFRIRNKFGVLSR